MSNVPEPTQDSVQPPAWAQILLQRLEALEQRSTPEPIDLDTSPEDNVDDPFVLPRSPDLDFTPYEAFREALPSMTKDFFRNPLPETDRKRYLSQCPRNVERNYQPPVLNQISVSNAAKRIDSQLSDIQYRLSGITRPLDFLLHKTLTAGPPSQEDVIHFVQSLHELLSDTASHMTQIRIDNMFKSAGIRGQAPRLAIGPLLRSWNPKTYWNTLNWQRLPCKSVVPTTVEERQTPRVVKLLTIENQILQQQRINLHLLLFPTPERIFAAIPTRRRRIVLSRSHPSRWPPTVFPKGMGRAYRLTLDKEDHIF